MKISSVRNMVATMIIVGASLCCGCSEERVAEVTSPADSVVEIAGDFSGADNEKKEDIISEKLKRLKLAELIERFLNSKSIENAVSNTVFPSKAGWLHVEKNGLYSEKGKRIQLRGISSHGIQWFPKYINQELFNELHTVWNANVVRLSMYTRSYHGYCEDGDKEELKQIIRNGIEYATLADLYVIVDWHILSDADPRIHQDEAIAFFDEISSEFGEYKNVIYEICNEPNSETTWSEIKEYANEVIPVIRNNSPKSLIIVGTPFWSGRPSEAIGDGLTEYENIMYSLHFYAASHGANERLEVIKCMDSDIPLFVTEFGICESSGNGELDYESGNAWIELLNQYAISYIQWNLSNADESSAAILKNSDKTSAFEDVDLSEHSKWLKNILKR